MARPFVTAAFAISSDGCLSQRKGGPTALSSPGALEVTHLIRSLHDAILVGRGTVLADDPLLTTRLVEGPTGQRVVLDTALRTPLTARLLVPGVGPVVFFGGAGADAAKAEALRAAGAVVELLEGAEVELPQVLSRLQQRGVRTLMVEGGARVLESFFGAGLVDYLSLTQAPAQVDGPDSVRLGPLARAALDAWGRPSSLHFGVDRVTFGRLFR